MGPTFRLGKDSSAGDQADETVNLTSWEEGRFDKL